MLSITPISAFSDNYIWLLQRDKAAPVVVVDPGQSAQVIQYLQQNELQLVAILITHQHYDHTGGVAELLKKYPQAKLIGPSIKPSKVALKIDLPVTDLFTQTLLDGDELSIPELAINFKALAVPGHTLDHLAFYGEGVVFCGDILFGAGCGRIFSGTAKLFEKSLAALMALPEETKMYCAHEYTVDNLGFAKWVEPDSEAVLRRDALEMQKQAQGLPTVPFTVGLEMRTNPFVRLAQSQVIQAAEKYAGKALTERWEIFTALREWKDKEYD